MAHACGLVTASHTSALVASVGCFQGVFFSMTTLEPARTITQTHNPFIPAWLDDARLTAAEFRVYCHIARRGRCFEKLQGIADICRLNRKTDHTVLNRLVNTGLLSAKRQYRQPVIYAVKSHSVVLKTGYGASTRNGLHKGSSTKGSKGTGRIFNARVIPSDQDVYDFAERKGIDEQVTDAFLAQRERDDWTIDGEQILSWRNVLIGFNIKYCENREHSETQDYD